MGPPNAQITASKAHFRPSSAFDFDTSPANAPTLQTAMRRPRCMHAHGGGAARFGTDLWLNRSIESIRGASRSIDRSIRGRAHRPPSLTCSSLIISIHVRPIQHPIPHRHGTHTRASIVKAWQQHRRHHHHNHHSRSHKPRPAPSALNRWRGRRRARRWCVRVSVGIDMRHRPPTTIHTLHAHTALPLPAAAPVPPRVCGAVRPLGHRAAQVPRAMRHGRVHGGDGGRAGR